MAGRLAEFYSPARPVGRSPVLLRIERQGD